MNAGPAPSTRVVVLSATLLAFAALLGLAALVLLAAPASHTVADAAEVPFEGAEMVDGPLGTAASGGEPVADRARLASMGELVRLEHVADYGGDLRVVVADERLVVSAFGRRLAVHAADAPDGAPPLAIVGPFKRTILRLALIGTRVVVAAGTGRAGGGGELYVVELGDPGRPRIVGEVRLRRAATDLAVAAGLVWLVSGNDVLEAYAVREPGAPRRVGGWRVTVPDSRPAVMREVAWVAEGHVALSLTGGPGWYGLIVMDVRDSNAPRQVGSAGLASGAGPIAVGPGVAIVRTNYGVERYDMGPEGVSEPLLLGGSIKEHRVEMATDGRRIWLLARGGGRLSEIDLPARPWRRGGLTLPDTQAAGHESGMYPRRRSLGIVSDALIVADRDRLFRVETAAEEVRVAARMVTPALRLRDIATATGGAWAIDTLGRVLGLSPELADPTSVTEVASWGLAALAAHGTDVFVAASGRGVVHLRVDTQEDAEVRALGGPGELQELGVIQGLDIRSAASSTQLLAGPEGVLLAQGWSFSSPEVRLQMACRSEGAWLVGPELRVRASLTRPQLDRGLVWLIEGVTGEITQTLRSWLPDADCALRDGGPGWPLAGFAAQGPSDLAVRDGRAAITAGSTLTVLDVSDPAAPLALDAVALPGPASGVAMTDDMFVATWGGDATGLSRYELTPSGWLVDAGLVETSAAGASPRLDDDLIWLPQADGSVALYEVKRGAAPTTTPPPTVPVGTLYVPWAERP